MHANSEISYINQSREANEGSFDEPNVIYSKLTENLFTGYANASTHMRSMVKNNTSIIEE